MTVVQMRPWGKHYARLVAEEVRGTAAKKRVTGVQMAEAAGVSPQSMSRRMTGSLPFSIDELAEVARVLDVSVMDLLPQQDMLTRQYVQSGNVLQLPPNTRRTVEREHLAPVISLADRRSRLARAA